MAVTLYDVMRPTAILSGAGWAWAPPIGHGGSWRHWIVAGVGIVMGVLWCWPMSSLAKYLQAATTGASAFARESVFLALYVLTFVSLVIVVVLPAKASQMIGGA
jgi:hypothetical protein